MSLIGRTVKVHGRVHIGDNCIIEDGVTLGHPAAIDLAREKEHQSKFTTLDEFYNAAATGETVIGNDSIIRSGTVMYSGVRIGSNFDCGHEVIIREDVLIGDSVYIKSHTHLMRNVRIGPHCRIAAVIADNSVVGAYCSVFGTLTHKRPKRYATDKGPWLGVIVGDHSLIGRGAVVLGPVTIGENSIIGANAIVVDNVPPGSSVLGMKSLPRSSKPLELHNTNNS